MKKILFAIPALLFSSLSHAACKATDFDGTWIMYQANLTAKHTGRCVITAAAGTAAGNCKLSNGMSVDVTGPYTVRAGCAVALKQNFTGGSMSFNLQLTRNKEAFAGRWNNTFGDVGTTSGVLR